MIRILIVDNDLTRAGLTARAVRNLKFGERINYALSPVQALFFIAGVLSDRHKMPPDIILLAEPLPDTRGIDALKAVSDAVSAHPVSIIVLADAEKPGNAAEYYRSGAAAYVVKRSVDPDYAQSVSDAVCFTAMVMGLIPRQARFLSPEQFSPPSIPDILQVHL